MDTACVHVDLPEDELIQPHPVTTLNMAECNDSQAAMYGLKSGKNSSANV